MHWIIQKHSIYSWFSLLLSFSLLLRYWFSIHPPPFFFTFYFLRCCSTLRTAFSLPLVPAVPLPYPLYAPPLLPSIAHPFSFPSFVPPIFFYSSLLLRSFRSYAKKSRHGRFAFSITIRNNSKKKKHMKPFIIAEYMSIKCSEADKKEWQQQTHDSRKKIDSIYWMYSDALFGTHKMKSLLQMSKLYYLHYGIL